MVDRGASVRAMVTAVVSRPASVVAAAVVVSLPASVVAAAVVVSLPGAAGPQKYLLDKMHNTDRIF